MGLQALGQAQAVSSEAPGATWAAWCPRGRGQLVTNCVVLEGEAVAMAG